MKHFLKMMPRLFLAISTLLIVCASARADGVDLEGTEWAISGASVDQTIVFQADKNMFGFAGCNRFFGFYKQEGLKITIKSLGSTRKYCGAALAKEETEFLARLKRVRSFTITKARIKFLDELGKPALRGQRAGTN